MKFPYTMGVETTAFFPDFKGNHDVTYAYKNIVAYEMKKANMKWHGCDIDCEVIEISSAADTRSPKKLLSWCEKLFTFYKKYGLTATHPNHVDGGAHLHVGGMSHGLKAAIIRDLLMRPYLTWIFTDPDDTESTDNINHKIHRNYPLLSELSTKEGWGKLHSDLEDWKKLPKIKDMWSGFLTSRPKAHELSVRENHMPVAEFLFHGELWKKSYRFSRGRVPAGDKYSMYRLSEHDTLEFRFFQATHDIEVQKSYVDFIQKYILWIEGRLKKRNVTKVVLESEIQLQERTAGDSVAEFKKLLKSLRLPYSRYSKLVRNNLYPRWRMGRERI